MTDPLAPIAFGLLGAILGSFLATIAIRWPAGRSALSGRSMCDTCGTAIAARDLVPVLSALALRGRCRACGAAIDPRHWRIEALAALIGVTAGAAAPLPEAIAGASFGWLLLLAGAMDVSDLWIPDALNATIALGGLATALLFEPPLVARLTGGAGGFAMLWTIGAGYRRLRGREGLGGADPKLFGAIGLWLGWQMLPAVLTLAALVGLGAALVATVRGHDVTRATPLPLGACLAVAAYPAWLAMIVWRA